MFRSRPRGVADDLTRFAEDLRKHAGLAVDLQLDREPKGLHVLKINGVDFFFCADGSGYDGWGKSLWVRLWPPKARRAATKRARRSRRV